MNQPIVTNCLYAAFLCGLASAQGGDDVVPRRTFRESSTYPHIFRAEGYLAGSGPVPMHIEDKPAAFSKRLAPPLTENAKGKEKPLPPLPDSKNDHAEAETDKVNHVGKKKEELPLPEPDLGKVPEAVMRFFRDKDGQRDSRPFLFDPIFQPARPNELPKSKATYVQKP